MLLSQCADGDASLLVSGGLIAADAELWADLIVQDPGMCRKPAND